MFKSFFVFCFLCLAATTLAENLAVHVIPVEHIQAEEVAPALKSVLQKDETLVIADGKLVLQSGDSTYAKVRTLLDELDQARQILRLEFAAAKRLSDLLSPESEGKRKILASTHTQRQIEKDIVVSIDVEDGRTAFIQKGQSFGVVLDQGQRHKRHALVVYPGNYHGAIALKAKLVGKKAILTVSGEGYFKRLTTKTMEWQPLGELPFRLKSADFDTSHLKVFVRVHTIP